MDDADRMADEAFDDYQMDKLREELEAEQRKPIQYKYREFMFAYELKERINEFTTLYPRAEFSFAHVVLSDYNLSDGHITDCLDREKALEWVARALDEEMDQYAWWLVYEEMAAICKFLHWLLSIDEDVRKAVIDVRR